MEDLLNFLAAAKTQYHAVRKLKEMLDKEGFKELNEEETYELNPLEKYYIIRNSSSIMAFKTPKDINDTYLKHHIPIHQLLRLSLIISLF